MEKFITFTDSSGQEQLIPCQDIAVIVTANPGQCTIEYFDVGQNPSTIVINHVTETTAHEFKLFMINEVEKALASNWREVEHKPGPPTAVTSVVYAP
tara:strand:- start:364 stop:654 length:291 start_codon:yes stop_codon:yes gene_type:complete